MLTKELQVINNWMHDGGSRATTSPKLPIQKVHMVPECLDLMFPYIEFLGLVSLKTHGCLRDSWSRSALCSVSVALSLRIIARMARERMLRKQNSSSMTKDANEIIVVGLRRCVTAIRVPSEQMLAASDLFRLSQLRGFKHEQQVSYEHAEVSLFSFNSRCSVPLLHAYNRQEFLLNA